MKYKIKHETKKKINEIIAAAENKDENLFRLLMQEVDKTLNIVIDNTLYICWYLQVIIARRYMYGCTYCIN